MVLSIAVGIFAIGVVMGGRGVLMREFDTDYLSSAAPSAEFYTTDFDASLVRSIESRSDVRAAEGRRQLLARYSTESPPTTSTAGWSTMQIWALPTFDSIEVQKITREEGSSWPPGPGEIVLEKSVQQVERFSIGETITVETETGSRAELRVVGFAHDINAVPAMFSDMVVGYVSMSTLVVAQGARQAQLPRAASSTAALSQAAASRIAVDVREKELGAAGVQALQTSVPEPGSHFLGDIFKAVSLLLLALGVLSLALSGFLVITTVSALMAQQIRQIGIMKAVGARWGQVMRMYLATVVLYGVLAVLVGVPVALWAGRWFIGYAAGLLNFRIIDWNPPAYVIALEIAVGLLVPVLAAIVPVRRGARTSVVVGAQRHRHLAELRPRADRSGTRPHPRAAAAGCALAAQHLPAQGPSRAHADDADSGLGGGHGRALGSRFDAEDGRRDRRVLGLRRAGVLWPA